MDNELAVKTNKVSNGKPQRVADAKQLQALGFTELSELADTKRRLAIAYEHYQRLTSKAWIRIKVCFYLKPIDKYLGEVPPQNILSALKQAQERECFEKFYVAEDSNDPILLGRVSMGFENHSRPFVIVSWGDDIDPKWLEKSTE